MGSRAHRTRHGAAYLRTAGPQVRHGRAPGAAAVLSLRTVSAAVRGQIRALVLSGSGLPRLSAATLRVDGVLRISGCRIAGPVRLRGAKVAGGFFLDKARLGTRCGGRSRNGGLGSPRGGYRTDPPAQPYGDRDRCMGRRPRHPQAGPAGRGHRRRTGEPGRRRTVRARRHRPARRRPGTRSPEVDVCALSPRRPARPV